jgi:hypothetical protein
MDERFSRPEGRRRCGYNSSLGEPDEDLLFWRRCRLSRRGGYESVKARRDAYRFHLWMNLHLAIASKDLTAPRSTGSA